jgi:maltose-binding protein MalE
MISIILDGVVITHESIVRIVMQHIKFTPEWLVILLCILLSACGSDEADTPPAPTPSPTIHPQVLVIWHPYQGVESDALAQIRADFEVKNPNIDVQLEFMDASSLPDTFADAVLAGGGPDLVFGSADWIPDLAARGVIQPFRQSFYDTIFSMVAEPVARAAYYQDSPYGLPFSADFPSLYFNRRLMITPPETFNNLVEAAASYGFILSPTFAVTSTIYLSLDAQFATTVTVDPAVIESFLVELQNLDSYPGVTFSQDQSAFLQGQAGLLMAPSSDYPALVAALGDDLGALRFPIDREWRGISTIWPVMQSLNSTSEALDAGEIFLTYLLSADGQRSWFEQTHHAPVNVAGLDNDMLRVAWSTTLAQSIPVPADFITRVMPVLDQAVQTATVNGGDPHDAAETAASSLQ